MQYIVLSSSGHLLMFIGMHVGGIVASCELQNVILWLVSHAREVITVEFSRREPCTLFQPSDNPAPQNN